MLLQSIDLAVAAEKLGAGGVFFRVHHFAQQLASPFPLHAAVGEKTGRIEIGTGVIDMRYESPLSMAEDDRLDPQARRPCARLALEPDALRTEHLWRIESKGRANFIVE